MSILKKYLSYIYDFPVEKKQSRFSGQVVVSYHRGQYKLSTEKAVYSFGKNYRSFANAFKAVDILNRNITSVLVLGFGLGSVVDLLDNHSGINSITAVDADEVIMELAKKYLFADSKKKVEYVVADAAQYIRQSRAFDLVLFDVFIEDETPMSFLTEPFLTALKKTVLPGGMLLYSKIESSYANKIENAGFEKVFSAVCPRSFSINTDGNRVYVWVNNPVTS